MLITIIGIPFAAWKYVGWLFLQQQILFEDKPMREAFRGSSELVRGRWWYTLRVAAVFWLIGIVTGPVLGFALIFADISADPDQRDRRARLRPARPLHCDRPHAPLLRPPGRGRRGAGEEALA